MCTVSFIARTNGYALAMNRDEKLARVTGLPPSKATISGRAVLAPSEPGGGTWIALNDHGATLALINWYSITARVKGETVSRGTIISSARAATTPDAVGYKLAELPLKRINPFRLIGVFAAAHEIAEWRWDLAKLVCMRHPWKTRQWISSGFDEPAAQRLRSQVFRQALKQTSVGSLDWLRRLHRSHGPQTGPFSTCMHRDDAATVSYTEVAVSRNNATMSYRAGNPCNCLKPFVKRSDRVCPTSEAPAPASQPFLGSRKLRVCCGQGFA